uniref:RRM domain-containing protein n=1 Tax=Manihot esculenta TaxID=3983 RepID=A0A2C9UZY7_MANES
MAAAPSLQPPGDLRQRASLYVGDLDLEVTEMDLKTAFCSVCHFFTLRLCRCAYTGKSLCYGYVNFYSHNQAYEALHKLNHTYLKGKPMRLMWSQRDPFARKSGIGNLFVKNLVSSIDSARLESMFCKFGTILSCKVVEERGKSKGFGFVQFDSENSALAARTALHNTIVEGKKLYVSKFVKKSDRTAATIYEESEFTNLYVKNLADNVTEDTLQNMFSIFGKVYNVVIMKDHDGKSRGFGFVNFDSPEGAKKAVDALNGSLLGSRTLFVGRAQNKAERIKILQHERKDIFSNHIEKLRLSNVYVKNLDECIDDNKLQEIFSTCGKIVSAKVMRYDNGVSRSFGFVCFSSPGEAKKALNTLNGIMLEGKSLYVAIAQSKKDRRLELEKYFSARQSQSLYPSNCNVVAPPIGPVYYNLSTFHPPIPFLQHQISYQNFGATMGGQYPLAAENYQQHFCSYIPLGQTHQSTQNLLAQSCQQLSVKRVTSYLRDRDLNDGHSGIQNFCPRKGWNNKAGSKSRGSQAITCFAATKSPDNCKEDIGNCLHPLGNVQVCGF